MYADKEKMRETRRRWHQTNPKKSREHRLRARFGITIEQYDAMAAEQEGKCAICKAHQKLEVDHDHATGKVRGLLCGFCNKALGGFREDQAVLLQAIGYLQRYT